MAYETEIEALKQAIASGATEVAYDGKRVTYASFTDLKQRLSFLEGLQDGSGAARPSYGVSSFDRGDDD